MSPVNRPERVDNHDYLHILTHHYYTLQFMPYQATNAEIGKMPCENDVLSLKCTLPKKYLVSTP